MYIERQLLLLNVLVFGTTVWYFFRDQ